MNTDQGEQLLLTAAYWLPLAKQTVSVRCQEEENRAKRAWEAVFRAQNGHAMLRPAVEEAKRSKPLY